MTGQFRYDAFISYARADSQLVDEIFGRLQGYRTPGSLKRRSGRYGQPPSRLNVFLDRRSVEAGGELSGRLREKLEQSRWLILICSENSRDRPWVNQEVEIFSQLQGPEYIIPIIVRETEETPLEAVLPPALLDLGESAPIGADLLLDGGVVSVVQKVVGAILGFGQDDIAREQDRADARRRRQSMAALTLGLILSVAAGAGLFGVFQQSSLVADRTTQLFDAVAQTMNEEGDHTSAMWTAISGLRVAPVVDIGQNSPPSSAELVRSIASNYLYKELEAASNSKWGSFVSGFSPDGSKFVAKAYGDPNAVIWEVESGREIARFPSSNFTFISEYFSSDGRYFLDSNRWDKDVIDLATGKVAHKIDTTRAVFAPDASYILSTKKRDEERIDIVFLDPGTGQEIRSIPVPDGRVTKIGFLDRGRIIYFVDREGRLHLLRMQTGETIATFDGNRAIVVDVAQSPNGEYLAVLSTQELYGREGPLLKLWSRSSGELITQESIRYGSKSVFSPDSSRMLVYDFNDGSYLYDTAEGTQLAHYDRFAEPSFSESGNYIVLRYNTLGEAKWVSAETGSIIGAAPDDIHVSSIAISPSDAHIAVAGWDGNIRLYDPSDPDAKVKFILGAHTDRISDAKFTGDGRKLISVSDDQTVRVWDTRTGEEEAVLRGHMGAVLGLSMAPTGPLFVTLAENNSVRVWSSENTLSHILSEPTYVSKFGRGGLPSIAVASADGRLLAAGATKEEVSVRIWDTSNWMLSWRLPSPEEIWPELKRAQILTAMAFSPDGRKLLTGYQSGLTLLWKLEGEGEVSSYWGPQRDVKQLGFSADGETFFIRTWDGVVPVWKDGADEPLFYKRHGFINDTNADISADGRYILYGLVRKLVVFDVVTGELHLEIELEDRPGTLQFSPDGSQILTTGGFDGTALDIFDFQTGEKVLSVPAFDLGSGGKAVYSADGKQILFRTPGQSILVLDSETGLPSQRILVDQVARWESISFAKREQVDLGVKPRKVLCLGCEYRAHDI